MKPTRRPAACLQDLLRQSASVTQRPSVARVYVTCSWIWTHIPQTVGEMLRQSKLALTVCRFEGGRIPRWFVLHCYTSQQTSIRSPWDTSSFQRRSGNQMFSILRMPAARLPNCSMKNETVLIISHEKRKVAALNMQSRHVQQDSAQPSILEAVASGAQKIVCILYIIILCYAMLCYAMLCYTILYYTRLD